MHYTPEVITSNDPAEIRAAVRNLHFEPGSVEERMPGNALMGVLGVSGSPVSWYITKESEMGVDKYKLEIFGKSGTKESARAIFVSAFRNEPTGEIPAMEKTGQILIWENPKLSDSSAEK